MDSMVRAASLRGLPALVESLGGDSTALLGRFRVPAPALESDDAVIPSPAAGRILETAAAELDCPDLGLRLAGQQNAAVLGPLALAIENSPTFGAALETANRFLFVHSPALTVSQIPAPSGRPGVVGLLYRGTELVEAVSDRPGTAAYRVERGPDGDAVERVIRPRRLA